MQVSSAVGRRIRRGASPLTAVVGMLLAAASAASAIAEVTPARQGELRHLLRHDCGSCHGMTLKGGLGPALLPERLRLFPRELLYSTVLDGRPGTPMPPWRGILTDEEARWLVDRILEGSA